LDGGALAVDGFPVRTRLDLERWLGFSVLDELNTLRVDAQAEPLTQEPAHVGSDTDLIDARHETQAEQTDARTVLVGFYFRVSDTRHSA
jgi:hypothetical protein